METRVFAYKGVIGIQSDPKSDALIAKPENGGIGCVADASKVKFSKDAVDLLKTIKKGSDDLGDVDVFKANDGTVVFGWMGNYLRVVVPKESEGSREYDPSLLAPTDGVEPTDEFKEFVDNKLKIK